MAWCVKMMTGAKPFLLRIDFEAVSSEMLFKLIFEGKNGFVKCKFEAN